MKNKLPLVAFLMVLAILFVILPSPKVDAKGFSPTIEVYIQRGEMDSPVLVHTYTQEEMETLSVSEPVYYTGIDSMPADVQGKGIGVLLNTFIYDLQAYDPGVSFGPGGSLVIYATDTYKPDGTHYSYTTIPYEYLFGEPRYYLPNLQVTQTANNKDMTGAIAIEPMICTYSIQDRHLTREDLDNGTMDTAYSYRLCFGLLPSEVEGTNPPVYIPTANKFVYWINRIDVIVPVYNITIDSNISGGIVTADKASAAAGDIITLNISPDTGKQLITDTLVAHFSDGTAISLSPGAGNTCAFTMLSSDVTFTAEFEVVPDTTCTATFISNGTIYTTETVNTGTMLNAPSNPIITGYSFTGWYSDQSFTSVNIFPCTITADQTFYAGWVQDNIVSIDSKNLYNILIVEDAGGNNTITTNAINGQAEAETAITITIDISQDSHKGFKAIKVVGIDESEIPVTEITAGQAYTFIMPYEDLKISVEFTDLPANTGTGLDDTPIPSTDVTPSPDDIPENTPATIAPNPEKTTLVPEATPETPLETTGQPPLPGILSESNVGTLVFDLSGFIDTSGEVVSGYEKELLSTDGLCHRIKLKIPPGTLISTNEKECINSIGITPVAQIPDNIEDKSVIAAFECIPDGSIFSSPISLSLYYSPDELPDGISEDKLGIVYYDKGKNEWIALDCEIDRVNHFISLRVNHFTMFAIVSVEESHVMWWVYGAAFIAVAVVTGSLLYIRHRNAKLAASWRVDE